MSGPSHAQPGAAAVAAAAVVGALLAAVRRRLWRMRFLAATRWAAWATAGLALAAAAVHGALRAVPVGALLAAMALVWLALLVRAARQRPDESACALWADQHLGGASAFTTWLETGPAASGPAASPAVRWLGAWTAARVPASLRQLAARRDGAQLARPLLAMATCSALAGVILTLPGVAPQLQVSSATRASAASAPTPLALGQRPEPAVRAEQISAALRAARPRDETAQGSGRAPAAGPAGADDGRPPALALALALAQTQAGSPPAGARAAHQSAAVSSTAATAAPAAGATQTAGSGGASQAGDSADKRADPGVARALRGTMAMQDRALGATRLSGQRQADFEQIASYDSDEQGANRGDTAPPRRVPAAAAATAPPATASMQLTPTETSYVQAWMKASPRRP